MSSDQGNSIAFLLGLNQVHDTPSHQSQLHQTTPSHSHTISSSSDTLLASLNSISSPSAQQMTQSSAGSSASDDVMNSFANQLAMWTNANFSFDGPMGHALIADDEKDSHPEKDQDERDRQDDSERQRQMAASGAHSSAARDKLRALDREPTQPVSARPSLQIPSPSPDSTSPSSMRTGVDALSSSYQQLPLTRDNANPLLAPHVSQPWTSAGHMDAFSSAPSASSSSITPPPQQQQQQLQHRQQQPVHSAPSSSPSQEWDLTSTLALQHLLNKNPDMLASLWQARSSNPSHPGLPSWQPPNQTSHLSSSSSAPSTGAMAASQATNRSSAAAAATSVSPTSTASSSCASRSAIHSHPLPQESNISPPLSSTPAATQKRSASISLDPAGDDVSHLGTALDDNTQSHRGRPSSSTLADRVKLVDTGNPEADAETNRLAIEEDKRRRNTAASARFRIKKKQREAALELSARELESQVNELKHENDRLRAENDWLRRLIMARPEVLPHMFSSQPLPTATAPPNPSLDEALQALLPQNLPGRH